MALLEGVGETIAGLGPRGRKRVMAIIVVALFLLNLNGVLADGDDHALDSPAFALALSSSSASIGDYVWDDQDGDGKQGSIYDVGIKGVELELWLDNDGNGQVSVRDEKKGTASTDDDGTYFFVSLVPGEYLVRVTDSNFESGGVLYDYALTTERNLLSVHVGEGDAYSEADFGYEALASPGGPGASDEPTAVALSSFMASSSSPGASPWPWLAVLATLATGGALWIRVKDRISHNEDSRFKRGR